MYNIQTNQATLISVFDTIVFMYLYIIVQYIFIIDVCLIKIDLSLAHFSPFLNKVTKCLAEKEKKAKNSR